jgi:hypothetical protein
VPWGIPALAIGAALLMTGWLRQTR